MGWGKILKKVKKVGNVVDPHALAIHTLQTKTGKTGANLSKNVETEGTKGVASYGGYAGVVAQVIPGVGTAVGAGLIAASVAAQIKLKQEALAKQEHENAALERQWAAADAATIADAAPGNDNAAVFRPTVPAGATTQPPLVTDGGSAFAGGGASSPAGGANGGSWINGLESLFGIPGTQSTLASSGAAPANYAPMSASGNSAEDAGTDPASSFKVPLLVGGAIVAALAIAVLALKR